MITTGGSCAKFKKVGFMSNRGANLADNITVVSRLLSPAEHCVGKKKKAASGQEIFSHAGMFLLEQHGYTARLCWLGKKDSNLCHTSASHSSLGVPGCARAQPLPILWQGCKDGKITGSLSERQEEIIAKHSIFSTNNMEAYVFVPITFSFSNIGCSAEKQWAIHRSRRWKIHKEDKMRKTVTLLLSWKTVVRCGSVCFWLFLGQTLILVDWRIIWKSVLVFFWPTLWPLSGGSTKLMPSTYYPPQYCKMGK